MNERLPKKMTRRAFLGASGKLSLGIAGVLAASSGLFYYGAIKHKGERVRELPGGMISLGDPERLDAVQGVEKIGYSGTLRDAWAEKAVSGFVYAARDDSGKLLIMSPACTHLGCTIEPVAEAERKTDNGLYFRCPCHGVEYDAKGNDLASELPSLDIYEPRLIDGRVYIDMLKPVKRNV